MFLQRIIIVVTISLRRLYASSIFSIFLWCMKSNASEKSTNKSVVSSFFLSAPSMIQWIIRICDVVNRFLQKPFRFFKRIFLNEKQCIINLSSYISKSHVSVVLSDFKVTFLEKERLQPFVHFSIVFSCTQCCILEEECHQIFLFSFLQKVFHLLLIF